ncbi:MAG: helix-turn-helix domain-containing protein [Symploca sp. SIO2C1]|nr:helix-turn-helix domain-containing protein [Symploca sp. SIO2C1]
MKYSKFHFYQEQIEKLEELGSRLQQFRTQQSITLEEVAQRTRIQARLLRAIEEGDLEQLPEPVYIKGFIKRFADALGLNGTEFASTFPTGEGIRLIRPSSWRHMRAAQLRPLHLYLLYIFLVIGAVNGLSYLVKRSAIQAIQPLQIREQIYQLPTPDNGQQIENKQKIAPNKATTVTQNSQDSQQVQVNIILKAESWIRVVVDGRTEFEGVLPEGTHRTWVAKEKLSVRAGNAGGVVVAYNDETAKQLGAPGEVQEVTFAANPGVSNPSY